MVESLIPPDTEVWFYFKDNVLIATAESNDAMASTDYSHCLHKDTLTFPNEDPIDIGLYDYTVQSDNTTIVRTDFVEAPPE